MSLHPPLEVSSREAHGIHYVDVHGRLTIGDPSEHLSSFMQNLVAKGARKVIVNLNEIPQIDSSGISALVKLSICGMSLRSTTIFRAPRASRFWVNSQRCSLGSPMVRRPFTRR